MASAPAEGEGDVSLGSPSGGETSEALRQEILGRIADQVKQLLAQARRDSEAKVKAELKVLNDMIKETDFRLDKLLEQLDQAEAQPKPSVIEQATVAQALAKVEQQWGKELGKLKQDALDKIRVELDAQQPPNGERSKTAKAHLAKAETLLKNLQKQRKLESPMGGMLGPMAGMQPPVMPMRPQGAVPPGRMGTLAEKEHVAFENVAPKRQFSPLSILQSHQPEVGEDAVHERLNEVEMQDFRRAAQERYADLDGYLDMEAIELLGLRLNPKGPLSRRLFQIAHLMVKRESQALTYYELLALHSVLTGGSREELQRLVFFVFDVDEDDAVSVDDFAQAMFAFLELQEQQDQAGSGLLGHDLEEFIHLDEDARMKLATLLAEDIIERYGAPHKDPLAPTSPRRAKPPARGRCLCGGRAPDEDASDSGKDVGSRTPRKTRSWSLCRGKEPVDDGIRHSSHKPLLDEGGRKSSLSRGKRTTSSLASPKKSRRGWCMCGGQPPRAVKKDLKPLNFEQWRHWFNDATGAKAHGADEPMVSVVTQQPPSGLATYGRSDPFMRRAGASFGDPEESSGSDR